MTVHKVGASQPVVNERKLTTIVGCGVTALPLKSFYLLDEALLVVLILVYFMSSSFLTVDKNLADPRINMGLLAAKALLKGKSVEWV